MGTPRAHRRPWPRDRARTIAGIVLPLLCLAHAAHAAEPRNIILFVADGCGYYHVDAASLYQYGRTGAQVYESFPLKIAMSTYNVTGNSYRPITAWEDFGYVDILATASAGAATAMSTGRKTREYLGLDMDGNWLEHAAERMKALGKSAGVVTSVQVNNATPAGFVAHHDDRNDNAIIAQQMFLDSRLDVIMGCGNPWYDNDGVLQSQPIYYDYVGGSACWNGLVAGLIDFDLDGNGTPDNRVEDSDGDGQPDRWTLIQSLSSFRNLMQGTPPHRVLGIPQVHKSLQYYRSGNLLADPYVVPFNDNVPSLAEMTAGAINVLDGNPDGFFLMVEGGEVDRAAAGNATGRMIESEIEFNRAVEAAVAWIESHGGWDETLLIVTGDHECGHLAGPGSGGTPPVWNPLVNHGAGHVPGLTWYSTAHTNSLIPLFAKGPGIERLENCADEHDPVRGRFLNNTEIGQCLKRMNPTPGGSPTVPENIVLLVASGAGYNHFLAASYYQYGAAGHQPYDAFPLRAAMSTNPGDGDGYARVNAWNDFEYVLAHPTDPGAAATSLSCGDKTATGAVGLDLVGRPLVHLTHWAKVAGKASGVVTSVPLSHAVSAGLVAHHPERTQYAPIAREMLLDSRLDLLMGCGNPWFDASGHLRSTPNTFDYVGGESVWDGLVAGATQFDTDGDQIPDNAVEDSDGDGQPDAWTLIETREGFQALETGATPTRVLGVPQVFETLQYRRSGPIFSEPYAVPFIPNVPTLEEMTRGALHALGQDPDGFFLAVIGGAVDWAAREHVAGRMLEEQIDFNHAVEAVVAWVEQNSDWDRTLVIVTADQESGYLTGPGSGEPHTWNPLVNHGAGSMPGLEWHSSGRTNSLIPLYAQGAAVAALAPFVEEFDQVRGYFINNSEIAQACRWLWEDPGAADTGPDAPPVSTGAARILWTPSVIRTAGVLGYVLDHQGPVELAIHDLLGRRIAVLGRGTQSAGVHRVRWDASGVPAGVYFARLWAGGRTQGCNVVVVR
jgi:alkaline phosphatase